jgi:hypothetical protein
MVSQRLNKHASNIVYLQKTKPCIRKHLITKADRSLQDIKLGGGAHFKKLRRAEGGAKIVGVFRAKNHDFTQKKIIFIPILGVAPDFWDPY